jgi:hypothetical protein
MGLPLQLMLLATLLTVSTLTASKARADISVRIELSRQTMNVDVDGVHYATWSVSTARRGIERLWDISSPTCWIEYITRAYTTMAPLTQIKSINPIGCNALL